MSLQEVRAQYKVFSNGEEVKPFMDELVESAGFTVATGKITVSASASDETVNVGTLGDIRLLELRVKPVDIDKVTLKLNSDTVVDELSPLVVYSENVTTLTASNSDTSEVEIFWRAINK